ncbi:MAG: GntR family transcriptional regulator [Chryseolinea sp.]
MKKESMALKAFSELRKKILSLEITPDTRLKENFWATRLGVSRVAIRESLTRLLGEGLVMLGDKGGYYVTSFSMQDIQEIRELREILELGALKLALPRLSKEHILRLEKICNDFTSMAREGYVSGAWEADLKFHETLLEFSGNRKLLQTYLNSHIPLFHQELIKSKSNENEFDLTDNEHRLIVKALKDKNLTLAQKHMKVHFARGAKLVNIE